VRDNAENLDLLRTACPGPRSIGLVLAGRSSTGRDLLDVTILHRLHPDGDRVYRNQLKAAITAFDERLKAVSSTLVINLEVQKAMGVKNQTYEERLAVVRERTHNSRLGCNWSSRPRRGGASSARGLTALSMSLTLRPSRPFSHTKGCRFLGKRAIETLKKLLYDYLQV